MTRRRIELFVALVSVGVAVAGGVDVASYMLLLVFVCRGLV